MNLTVEQADALRELGNIGAAHAATTLSMMLNTSIDMNIPEINIIDLSRVHEYISDDPAAMVLFQINGEVEYGGYLLWHVPVESAIRLVNVMLGEQDTSREFSEMDRSALLEIGNIMVSAFLDSTATLLNTVMLPSPPDLVIDMPHAAFEVIISSQLDQTTNEIVLFQTELTSLEHALKGNILLLPTSPMLDDIIQKLENVISGV
jgi:chemotaxis protein CheY-P-specific phosphatase CheC